MDDTSSTSSSRSSESPTEGIGAIGPEERSHKEASEDVSFSEGVGPVPPPLNYKSKQYPYPISPEQVSRAKRCLWEVDREEVDTSLHQELSRIRQEESIIKSAKWNYDFIQEKPLKGGWQWEVSKDPPSFYQSKDIKGTKRKRESEVASSSSEAIPGVSFRSVRSTTLVKDNESSGADSSTVSTPSLELRHPTKKSRIKEPVVEPPPDIQPQVMVGSSSPGSVAPTPSVLSSRSSEPGGTSLSTSSSTSIEPSLVPSSSASIEPSLVPSSSASIEPSLVPSSSALSVEPSHTPSLFANAEHLRITSTFAPIETACTTSTLVPLCTTSTFAPVESVCTTSPSSSSVIESTLRPSSSSNSFAVGFHSPNRDDQVSQAPVDIISSSADSRLNTLTTVTDSSSSSTSSSSSSSPGSLSISSRRVSSQLTIPTTSFYQSNADPPQSKDSRPSSSSSSSSNTTSSTHQNIGSRTSSTHQNISSRHRSSTGSTTTPSSSSTGRRSSSQPSRTRHSPTSPGSSSRRSTTSGWLKYFR